jgi:uncharacterized phage protein gp47/JayE
MTAITDEGFVRTRLDERLAALESAVRGIFGSDIDLAPETPDGQLLGIFAEAIADIDELAEAVYNGRSPAGARGAALSRLVRLNGITRKAAQFSTATVTFSGTPGTVIPIGSLVGSTDDPTAIFATIAALTISGAGTVSGTVRATVAGAVPAPAGSLTLVQTVISGWTGANNVASAGLGTDVEKDPPLRVRRAGSVAIPSQGILDGLYAALLQVPDVTRVAVFENPTDVVDVNGLPRHSIQVIVQNGDLVAIAQAIWLKASLGVTKVGVIEHGVVDSQGITQVMRFDRPIEAPVFVTVLMPTIPGLATIDILKAAIVAWGTENSQIGSDVIWSQLFIPLNTVPGLDIVNVFLGLSAGPTDPANLSISYNAIATWDPDNIVFADFA